MFSIVDKKSFEFEVLSEIQPVLLAYIRHDYGYIEQTKALEAISKRYEGALKICLVDESSIETFKRCGIDGSPAFVIFHKGEEKGRRLGKADRIVLGKFVSEVLLGLKGQEGVPRVLIVDDEEAIRYVFHKFLADAGYNVSVAEHEDEAKEVLLSNRFDVAVVDQILPGGQNGIDLVKDIKNMQPTCEVIMVSGFPDFEGKNEFLEVGELTFLTKPVKKDEIVRAVDEAAEKCKVNRALL